MSAAFYINELTTLSSEAKRKNTELRNAADRSLQEVKVLPANSEQQLAADLSRRPTFVDPFVIACSTQNPKFATVGIVCLQRLIISKALPKTRLQDALTAFNSCTDLSLDIQLKILQALPSLLQNYVHDLQDELLSSTLQVCSSLQAVKAATVSGVAKATLQQLVTTVFEKVSQEDRHAKEIAATVEVPGKDGPLRLRPAAYDAYRVFRDLALAAEDRKTKFVQFTSFSVEAGLELIWTCIDANSELFEAHDELMAIIGSNVFPIVIRSLTEKLSYPITTRSLRVLELVLERYLHNFPADCEAALSLCVQNLEPDALLWKRALVMELLRSLFTDSSNLVDAYALCDGREKGKPIIQDIVATFVRLSTERPTVIGLGQQSTIPTGPVQKDLAVDPSNIDATSGVAGVISSALGVPEVGAVGISAQWSLPKTPFIELIDKPEPPMIPETYIYALVLECLTGLADSLARTVLPLTVQRERSKSKPDGHNPSNGTEASGHLKWTTTRSHATPINPLEIKDAAQAPQVRAAAALVENCWPAVLATSSTFLNAALDDQYFRNLIKSYQRFAQVAGLLRLDTPRDALMTTLAKAAVPPHVASFATSELQKSPVSETTRIFSNPKNLLSVDSFSSQASSSISEREKKITPEGSKPMLTVRNLMCLRALLNLAIALGLTLQKAFAVVVGVLRQADLILSSTTPQQISRQTSSAMNKSSEHPAMLQAFAAEVAAVESAASRLLESTADYPNDAFVNVLETFCSLLHGSDPSKTEIPQSPSSTPKSKQRAFSGLPGLSTFTEQQVRDCHFVIPKVGHLAELNVLRFSLEDPAVSGWSYLTEELAVVAKLNDNSREARRMATNVLVRLAAETIAASANQELEARILVQRRALGVLQDVVQDISHHHPSAADLEVLNHIIDSLQEILERSGDTIASGWSRIFAIVSHAFEHDDESFTVNENDDAIYDWVKISHEFVSPQAGRTAFIIVQLVSSDFLAVIPMDVMADFVELLYRFMRQDDDLNAALTTISMAWNASDMLFRNCEEDMIDQFIKQANDFDDLEDEIKPLLKHSRVAQWTSLLLKLRNIAIQSFKEVRNAAFQTICNVFRSHAEDLPIPAWDFLLRNTILHVSRADFFLYQQNDSGEDDNSSDENRADIGMSKAIIAGNAEVVSRHIKVVEQIAKLPGLWEVFLSMLERYLDLESHALSASVYSALSRVLAAVDPALPVWKGPIFRTVHLWLKRVPHPTDSRDASASNQEAFEAYVGAGREIYRLTRDAMSMSQTRTLIDNLYRCIDESDASSRNTDVVAMSTLQARTLELLKDLRADQANIPSCLITIAAKFVTLHHDSSVEPTSHPRPTYVALASASIKWLQDLITTHINEDEVWDSGSLLLGIASLRRLIESKYEYRTEHKSLPLWQRATTTALALAQPVAQYSESKQIDGEGNQALWLDLVKISGGIVAAQGLHMINDPAKIAQDQIFDITHFQQLQATIISRLGRADISPSIRLTYTHSLFTASLIHHTDKDTLPISLPLTLQHIQQTRRGRWKPPIPAARETMAYVCFKSLITLGNRDNGSAEHIRLAQAAAPLLLLRLAIVIRAYIVDQPLRGRRPQLLSELEELLFCLATIKDLNFDDDVLLLKAEEKDVLGRDAVRVVLLPLLVEALAVAGDEFCGSQEVFGPLQETLAVVVGSG